MVDEKIFDFVWKSFEVIKVMLTSIKISFGGATVNLLQFSFGIIVFGVLFGLFINYTKGEGLNELNGAVDYYKSEKAKRIKREQKKNHKR